MEKGELERLLSMGLSLTEIGRRMGRDASTVGYWVAKHGLAANGRDKYAPRGGLEREVLEQMVARGMSMSAMSRELGVSLATVRHWMRRYGLRSTAYMRGGVTVEKPQTVERECRRHGVTRFTLGRAGHYRCARCNSQAVSERRRRVKRILVEEAGGSCALCGYDSFPGALQFHHREPSVKSFELSRNGVTRSLAEARAEAAKCVLLCANCHAEVEAGVATL
jgi:transposase-like protein